jgi:ATP-dependent DNA helicase RecQ
MAIFTRKKALSFLCQAIGNPRAEFRSDQYEAVDKIVNDHAKLLVVQATGWGKSLVYFLGTKFMRLDGAGPTLLISPLLALMRNQILMAERIGIKAATINSNNPDEWESVKQRLLNDQVDILLISPERLSNQNFRENMLIPVAERIGLLVVDEAHCISDWGHDFRPDYRRIVRILNLLPDNIAVLGTTATANDRVIEDIVSQVGDDIEVIRGPLGRPSLRLQNITLKSQAARMAWIAEHIPNMPGSGIIYTLTIKDAQYLADFLQSQKIDAFSYWGGLDAQERIRLEDALLKNEIKALVSTTALGMGYDKPDLGFVVHFQRPGSVVHYYQQVGRAGRAVDEAYGILLSGEEDKEIIDYFIQQAFPPSADAAAILEALDSAEDGLSVPMLQKHVNLSYKQIEKVLKLLDVEDTGPVSKIGSKWYRNPVKYNPDLDKIEKITGIRRSEQDQMQDYMKSSRCLMTFLQEALNDPQVEPCCQCSICAGHPLIPESFSLDTAKEAVTFLKRSDKVIEPRKKWFGDALNEYGWRGFISEELRAEQGRALCLWGDAGWGELVKKGKQQDGHFDDRLISAAAEMVASRWRPEPYPVFVAAVPSLNHPKLVPDYAVRLASTLNLPFVDCIVKVRHTQPQKFMQNSYQQAANLVGAFEVQNLPDIDGPLLLVDDMVDSKWTLTVLTALLRDAGSGPVYPLALAVTTPGWNG